MLESSADCHPGQHWKIIFGVCKVKFFASFMATVFLLISLNAEAGRLSGGRKMGRQSSNVGQQGATPPAAPAQQSAQRPAQAAPAPMAQPAPRRPWGAMLGGLAAGLGLAWLAHSLGFGEAFGNILMVALFAMLAIGLIGWLMRRRMQAAGQQPFAVAGGNYSPSYRPENVGNDASARPFERSNFQHDAGGQGSMIGSALGGSQSWGVPAGFDTEGFLAACKRNFVSLQAAWDHSDLSALRAFMTDDMLNEIKTQLAERDTHTGTPVNVTEVVMLDARLLGIEEGTEDYLASVEFSGMIRENPSIGPAPFREVWNMSKPKDGSAGWLVAGVQALQ
jgi:predicted lipid-binding transport protein (Tim44 family)